MAELFWLSDLQWAAILHHQLRHRPDNMMWDNMMWDNMMWGSDYPHSESTFPRSRKILAEILEGVLDDEQARIAGGNTARV